MCLNQSRADFFVQDAQLTSFNEAAFKQRVGKALERVKTILDVTRQPQLPASVHHQYEDKYQLAEFVTRLGVAAMHQILVQLGVSEKDVDRMRFGYFFFFLLSFLFLPLIVN